MLGAANASPISFTSHVLILSLELHPLNPWWFIIVDADSVLISVDFIFFVLVNSLIDITGLKSAKEKFRELLEQDVVRSHPACWRASSTSF